MNFDLISDALREDLAKVAEGWSAKTHIINRAVAIREAVTANDHAEAERLAAEIEHLQACTTAKVKGSAHGIRKLAATIIADHGGSEHELQAMFGWQTNKQSAVYTGEANKKRLAIQAASKLAESEHMRTNQSRTLSRVRENGKKTK